MDAIQFRHETGREITEFTGAGLESFILNGRMGRDGIRKRFNRAGSRPIPQDSQRASKQRQDLSPKQDPPQNPNTYKQEKQRAVQEAIKNRELTKSNRKIMNKDEHQEWWSNIMLTAEKGSDKLKASELFMLVGFYSVKEIK
ncbi:MAG: hypothetical protein GY705_28775 [Bacteroidetes bacterium]|nr:hypothetical protein [Bacteroidota bacterium]